MYSLQTPKVEMVHIFPIKRDPFGLGDKKFKCQQFDKQFLKIFNIETLMKQKPWSRDGKIASTPDIPLKTFTIC